MYMYMYNDITQSVGYLYPPEYQSFIKLIIMRNQKPYFVKGFKMTKCPLETFKKVWKFNYLWPVIFDILQLINTAASIFMLLEAVSGK